MTDLKPIKNAIISVYNKDNIDDIALLINKLGASIYSTGGTQTHLESLGLSIKPIETLTGYPSILGGRVKTLHPKVFGGILGRTELASDREQLATYEIPSFDLVIVDLYPFEDTLKHTDNQAEIIEKIDIGGISLLRASAKNYNEVTVISSRSQYASLINILQSQGGQTTHQQRKRFAAEAFFQSSNYDQHIFSYFNQEADLPYFTQSSKAGKVLRYGENPHQKGIFYGDLTAVFDFISGKELSYNNLLDINAGFDLIGEFNETTCIILKHNNACGIASRPNVKEAWLSALKADPISAFGGVIVINQLVDTDAAIEIDKLFFEIIIANGFTESAIDLLKKKPNRIILKFKQLEKTAQNFRTILNGILVQDHDSKMEAINDFKLVTQQAPSGDELRDLAFAAKVAKHSKSNTIVLAKDLQLFASGVGQTSRVDALKQAIEKAHAFGFDLTGAVMASDAFFPFPDCVEIAAKAGIKAVIQPGGSIKDKASIDFCDAHGVGMVFTGIRHFKH